MNKYLLVVSLMLFGLAGYSQSGNDFPIFGNEMLTTVNKIEIFPNPSTDYINVVVNNSTLAKTTLIIHNIIGSRFEVNSEETSDNNYKIDIRDLPAGYYLLSIKDPVTNFSETYKFLKR